MIKTGFFLASFLLPSLIKEGSRKRTKKHLSEEGKRMNKTGKILTRWGLIALFLAVMASMSSGQPPTPGPGFPTPPTPEVPKVKPPGIPPKPDLLLGLLYGSGLGDFPDLYPDNPGMGPSIIRISGQVLNGGRVEVRGCEVDVFLSNDRNVSPDDRLMGTIVITATIPPAVPGRYGSATIPRRDYSIIGIPSGTYYICAKADPRNRIDELDERNNEKCVSEPIRIHPAGAK